MVNFIIYIIYMKIYESYKKNAHLINLILIISLALFVFQKNIEHFDSNLIDFSSLKNLANIADGLLVNGTFTFPGNLVINEKFSSGNDMDISKTLTVGGKTISYDTTNKILKIPVTTEFNNALTNRNPETPSIIVSGCVSTATWIDGYDAILKPTYIPNDSSSFGQQWHDKRDHWFVYKSNQDSYLHLYIGSY